jgi:hypothetical protein
MGRVVLGQVHVPASRLIETRSWRTTPGCAAPVLLAILIRPLAANCVRVLAAPEAQSPNTSTTWQRSGRFAGPDHPEVDPAPHRADGCEAVRELGADVLVMNAGDCGGYLGEGCCPRSRRSHCTQFRSGRGLGCGTWASHQANFDEVQHPRVLLAVHGHHFE